MLKLTRYLLFFSVLLLVLLNISWSQPLNQKTEFTRQDTLRGSVTPERAWWNVLRYDISVTPDYFGKRIEGYNIIEFEAKSFPEVPTMQIDLQEPMKIDSILFSDKYKLNFKRDGNAYFVTLLKGKQGYGKWKLKIFFSGSPRIAENPPWSGGWIFTKDAKGRPWMTVACQGLGASVWYPCKDHQGDEPDNGASLTINADNALTAVGNGRPINKKKNNNGTTSWTWEVKNPINNYNIVPYIGYYVNNSEIYKGEKGSLSCNYWVMDYNREKAKKQFGRDVKPMLKCFEYWFGPYPFYEDGYKLVESPHLGMEHQGAIAYGNHYLNGYLGMDLSGTGWGNKWDYIVVHESGHEWFANNITTNDIADMWVHEGFTNYAEVLFVECKYGKKAADEYCFGIRNTIKNDMPVIGPYGVNKEGSDDVYAKGANMLHTIRQVINNDTLFRKILRGLNKEFYHRTVDSKDIEAYLSKQSGKDLSKIFDQYLRTTKTPVLEYKSKGGKLSYRWTNCVNGFNMPLQMGVGRMFTIYPTMQWQEQELPANCSIEDVNKNFYISLKKLD